MSLFVALKLASISVKLQLYEDATQEARLIIDDSDATQADRFVKQIEVIDIAIDRLESLIGGYTFEGLALVPNGEIIDGTFAAFGPSVYFSAKDAPFREFRSQKSMLPRRQSQFQDRTSIKGFKI